MSDENTSKKILEHAVIEFAEKGVEGARMQSIADRADINKAMLHYYFRNKELLYSASIRNIFFQFNDAIKGAAGHAENLEKFLVKVIDAFFAFHKQHPQFVQLLLREALGGMKHLKKIAIDVTLESEAPLPIITLQNAVTQLQNKGEIHH